MRVNRSIPGALVAALAVAAPASAGSLYSGPGPRPGPDLLYAKAAKAPQLTNGRGWRARPILVSGTRAYRRGEFLYQDFLYDDHGAQLTTDPSDPRTAGNLFSKPNGTLTYPTDRRYAENAADLVELRVRPARRATVFRITLNTLKDRRLVAFSLALGRGNGRPRAFPFGANVRAPASSFLTVHPQGRRLVGVLHRAANGRRVTRRIGVRVDARRRQVIVTLGHRWWNPRRKTVRLAMGVGLWDASAGRYLLPRGSADATHPGGAGTTADPAAFFNVAFRYREPRSAPTEGFAAVTDAAWWRDRDQGDALAARDISRFHADVSFAKLARRATDNRRVPRSGAMNRILPSHFELAQGVDHSQACLPQAATCPGQFQGRLQPYAIYVPKKRRPARGWGMTLLMHSLSANYNQYLATRNMSQFGERSAGSIVVTPEARGPDEFYENYGAADVFDVWNDVARRFRLDPSWAVATGYSMGGFGTFTLASQFPDLFARAQPTVGRENNLDVLPSLRNVPVRMWNNRGDELVQDPAFQATASTLDSLGYRYELDAFQPCANPGCSPVTPNHLQLAINDQFAPAAAWLGAARVDRNPPRVTYVVNGTRNKPALRLVGDHAYWLSRIVRRDPARNGPGGDPIGQIDARSSGFGVGNPVVSPLTETGAGTLSGGNFGSLAYTIQRKRWTSVPRTARADRIDVNATNVASATIDVKRARVSCKADVRITSDGPIALTLAGCGRVVRSSGGGVSLPLGLGR